MLVKVVLNLCSTKAPGPLFSSVYLSLLYFVIHSTDINENDEALASYGHYLYSTIPCLSASEEAKRFILESLRETPDLCRHKVK